MRPSHVRPETAAPSSTFRSNEGQPAVEVVLPRSSSGSQASTLTSSSSSSSSSVVNGHVLLSKPPSLPYHPPRLSFDPWTKRYSILVCTVGLLIFDLVIPCIVYYCLDAYTDLDIAINLGISCASLGLGEMLELPLRGYRLVKQREFYAPIGQTAKWGFDSLFWWYNMATVIGVVPYVFSTSLDEPILWMFLMTPGMIVLFAVTTAAVSAIPFRLPFRVSSDEKGTNCKPFVYYVLEDFIAVDAGQGRPYREELRARWNASPAFRRLLSDLNLWWIVGGVCFIGLLAGVTWGCEFNVAYGLSLGLLFAWIGVWALATLWWVKRELRREREWFLNRAGSTVGEKKCEVDMV